MKSISHVALLLGCWFLGLVASGCGPKQPAFDALHPVTGKITYGGQEPKGGVLQLKPIVESDEFMHNGVVAADGGFELTTVRSTDTKGERKKGVPAGEYRVVFIPPVADQTVTFEPPVTLDKTVTVEAKANVLSLDAPKPKANP